MVAPAFSRHGYGTATALAAETAGRMIQG